jgi:hypothetical protein
MVQNAMHAVVALGTQVDFGAPLHCLVLAGDLHITEQEMLEFYMLQKGTESDRGCGDGSGGGDGGGNGDASEK